ncbi:MAG: 2-oxoacid:ferredoxin oxidoreductase subunit beta [Nitrososphaerales archaeon]|nr:2-oxoacid:ferredoxin oxidoreductase subunit beta [Nitrososphaerales archaeon]
MAFDSDVKPDWCPGCGGYGILASLKSALTGLGLEPRNVAIASGIGCSSNLPGYIRAYGFHGLHGRPVRVAIGIKSANPSLTVVVTAGDGDEYGIGFNHVINAARRNDDIKLIVSNNSIYGLTTGQASPTSELGQKTKTTPDGSMIYPLNPLSTLLGAGATFVARGFSGEPKQLTKLIEEAVLHRGFALVDVISPCVIWNDTYAKVRSAVYKLEDMDYRPDDQVEAYRKVNETPGLPIGIFYRTESKPTLQEMAVATNGGMKPIDGVRNLEKREAEDLMREFY